MLKLSFIKLAMKCYRESRERKAYWNTKAKYLKEGNKDTRVV